MSKVLTIISSIVVVVIFLFGLNYLNNQVPGKVIGSIDDGGAYTSTSTSYTWATLSNGKLIKSSQGILGSVIIPNATTIGTIILYDATTTVNGAIYATTTLAQFNTGATSGTYTFDIAFSRGLLVVTSATLATSTITFK